MSKKTNIILLIFLTLYQFALTQNNPVANDDYDTVEINTTLTVAAPGVLVNDTDADGDTLTLTEFSVFGRVANTGETLSIAGGDITVNADGSYTFVPLPGFTGEVPRINYTISDGTNTSQARLYLTVEHITNLIEISSFGSCNQGYTALGEYLMTYFLTIENKSTARDYHANNLIKNLNLTNDLTAIYGNGCVKNITIVNVSMRQPIDYVNNPYPMQFDVSAINPNYLNGTSNDVFTTNASTNFILYPRQTIDIQICVAVDPFCNGRPNPTPSGSNIDFDNIMNISSTIGSDSKNVLLTDFHTQEAVVSAGFFVPEESPEVNSNGTFDYINTVVILNEGTATARNVNYNMGLESFLNNGITFNQLKVSQISGPAVTVNTGYDGDTNTTLLAPNNSLPAGEKIVLEIFHLIAPVSSSIYNIFNQSTNSQTQGILDGLDENTPANKRYYSFVYWSDGLGDHLDGYYPLPNATLTASSTYQCLCYAVGMSFTFGSASSNTKVISSTNKDPNGILEHEEITFQLTATNTSPVVELSQLTMKDDLSAVCTGQILSVTTPIISSSTATTNPILNPNFNGISDIDIFNNSSGLLKKGEAITVEFTVVFNEDCIGINTSNFSAIDPSGSMVNATESVAVNVFTDTDNDGISNFNDIDDDNDTVLDVLEYSDLNPLDDVDNDNIPNYRDTDYGADSNNDGIIDIFDFDKDGVPNHFDLDSDNDGILDIVEAGNSTQDTSKNGRTNNGVGANGFDNTLENSDIATTTINYTIINTDGKGTPNYLDIDSDDDGIVDIIEAQTTTSFKASNGVVNSDGIDTAFPSGITPVDTESDGIPDYIDTNSDGDIRDDAIESWDLDNDGIAEIIFSNSDTDNDGLDDAYDMNDAAINPTNGQTPLSFPNVDNSDTTERDWREIIAIIVIIDNITVTEGSDLVFTISLVTKNDSTILIQSTTPINIDITTTNGRNNAGQYEIATAPFDYTTLKTTINIAPLTDKAQITISSLDDPIYELPEYFTVDGNITSNNTITKSFKGTGLINDNEEKPSITMNNSMENEGVSLAHTVTISHPSSTPVILDVATSSNTAISPEDYIMVAQKLTIAGTIDPNDANTTAAFSIITLLDNLNESDQEKLNILGTVTTTNIGNQDLIKTGTIIDIDPFPVLGIDIVTVVEGKILNFTISLLNANARLMQNYLPINLSIQTVENTAIFDDFNMINKSIILPAFTSTVMESITTIDDKLNEDTEQLFLRVAISSTNPAEVSSADGTGTIKDNDFTNLFTPNFDGVSDIFKLLGIEDFPNFSIIILDRWGSEVYNYSNNGNITPLWWDGTHNGNPVPEGVYYYTLSFNDGITDPIISFIQLAR